MTHPLFLVALLWSLVVADPVPTPSPSASPVPIASPTPEPSPSPSPAPGAMLLDLDRSPSSVETPEVSTDDVVKIVALGHEALVDLRTPHEFAVAHIPGGINVPADDAEALIARFPDKDTRLVLYCGGPYCQKTRRVAADLRRNGYTQIRRYQLGLPFWRALGHAVQTDVDGFRYVLRGDKTAVFVDARALEEIKQSSMPTAVRIRFNQVDRAAEDGRLPQKDRGTRVIVFGATPEAARAVAQRIAQKGYWTVSYFGGTYEDLKRENWWSN